MNRHGCVRRFAHMMIVPLLNIVSPDAEIRPLFEEDTEEVLYDPPADLIRMLDPHGGLFNERGSIDATSF